MKNKEIDTKLRKKVFRLAGITDYKYLETKYEEMASNGWLIEASKGALDTYVKVEPIELDFNVSLFQPTGPLEYPDQNKEKLYKELCEDGGWTYATSNDRYQIYYKPAGADAIPIHTDPVEEYNTIKSAFFKSEIFFPIIILIQFLPMLFSIKSIGYDSFLRASGLISIISPLFLTMIFSVYFFPVLVWFIKNSQRVKRGETILFESSGRILLRNRLYIVMTALYLIYIVSSLIGMIFSGLPLFILGIIPIMIIVPLAIGLGMRYMIKHVKNSKKENFLILIAASIVAFIVVVTLTVGIVALNLGGNDNDNDISAIPDVPILTYSDFKSDLEFEPRRVRIQSSFWSPLNFEYNSWYKDNIEGQITNINVEYIKTRFDWVTSMIVKMILDDERERIEQERSYNIEGVTVENYVKSITGYEDQVDYIYNLSSYSRKVILIKEKTIYIVSLDVPIEDEVLDMVVNKLFGN